MAGQHPRPDPPGGHRPGLPGPAGQDILERSPGRWSASRPGRPPRWLLAAAALLLAAGTAVAVLAHQGRPDQGGRVRPAVPAAAAPVVAAPGSCREMVRLDKSTVRIPDCLPLSQAGPPGYLPLRTICVPVQVTAGHRPAAARAGTRRRCYPGMS